jgi:hypothetical protein
VTPDFIAELHRAADADEGAPPDPGRLLAVAKRRDGRRRVAAAVGGIGLVSAMVAAIGVGSAILDWPASGPDGMRPAGDGPATTSTPPHDSASTRAQQTAQLGVYTPQRVPRDEVLGACKSQLDAMSPDPRITWRIDPGRSDTVFHAGDEVGFVGNDQLLVTCTLPGSGLSKPGIVTGPIAAAGDPEGILRQCGTVAGYDFTGWHVDSAMSQGDGTEAMLASRNGYTATCALEPAGWDAGSGQTVDLPSASDAEISEARERASYDSTPYYVFFDSSALDIKTSNPLSGALVFGGVTLFDPNDEVATDAATVTLSYQGASITRPVVNGHLAVRWVLPDAADADIPFDAVVKDTEGNVLASYNASDPSLG